MNPIYNLRHKIQMLKDFLQLLSTGPVTWIGRHSDVVFVLYKSV